MDLDGNLQHFFDFKSSTCSCYMTSHTICSLSYLVSVHSDPSPCPCYFMLLLSVGLGSLLALESCSALKIRSWVHHWAIKQKKQLWDYELRQLGKFFSMKKLGNAICLYPSWLLLWLLKILCNDTCPPWKVQIFV
jgi:hypothetical protein